MTRALGQVGPSDLPYTYHVGAHKKLKVLPRLEYSSSFLGRLRPTTAEGQTQQDVRAQSSCEGLLPRQERFQLLDEPPSLVAHDGDGLL